MGPARCSLNAMKYAIPSVLIVALTTHASAFAACAHDVSIENHTLAVSVGTNGRTSVTETWEVDVGDPTACPDGIEAPPGLEGGAWGEFTIMSGRTPPPPAAGAQTWTKTYEVRSGASSGLMADSPIGPARTASATLSAPSWTVLGVWADASSTRTPDLRRTHTVTVSWPEGANHELAWSTTPSWWEASKALETKAAEVVATSRTLTEWGDLGLKSIDDLINDVAEKVSFDPAGARHWLDAKKATEVLKEGKGGAADRAALLLSGLRVAGYDAQPAWARARPLQVPTTFPCPAAMARPLIRVTGDTGTRWIDPMLPATTPPLPADLTGALVQVAGDYPILVESSRAPRGAATLEVDLAWQTNGDFTVTGNLLVTGNAASVVLAGNPERPPWLPAALGLRSATTPVETDTGVEVTFEANGRAGVSSSYGGIMVDLEPIIGPALAAFLPAGTEVMEIATWKSASPTLLISATQPTSTADQGEVITGLVTHDGDVVTLITAIVSEHPKSLSETLPSSHLLAYPDPSTKTLKTIKKAEASAAARVAIEARAMVELGDTKKLAAGVAKAAKKIGTGDLAAAFAHHHRSGELEAWQALYKTAETDPARLQVVLALASVGETREAWRLAGPLAGSSNLDVQVQALVAIATLQGDTRPKQDVDEEAWRAWREPLRILKTALNRDAGSDGTGHWSVRAPLTDYLVRDGEAFDANKHIDAAVKARDDDGYTRAVAAVHAAAIDKPLTQVLDHLTAAEASSPGDIQVAALATRTWAELGHPDRATDNAILTARLAVDDAKLWFEASEQALDIGDLRAAVWAAGRASDLDPHDSTINVKYQLLATFIGDPALAALASERSGYTAFYGDLPAPLEELLRVASDDQHLALLLHRDADVVDDPELLSQRMALALDAGLHTVVARDGARLAKHHRNRFGEVGHAQAVSGDWWSNQPLPSLTRALREPSARRARMEAELFTGTGDPIADAKQLKKDPLADLILRALAKPDEVAKEAPVWALDREDPAGTFPEGCVENKVLGGPNGLVACTSVLDRSTTMWTTQNTSGRFPPPLGLLLTLGTPEPGEVATFEVEGTILPVHVAIVDRQGGQTIGIGLSAVDAARAATRELVAEP